MCPEELTNGAVSFSFFRLSSYPMKPQIAFRLFILTISLFFSSLTSGQWYDPQKVGKKAGAAYGKALELADMGNYKEALAGMAEAIRLDSNLVDAYLSRAGIFASMKDYQSSVTEFQKAFTLDTIYCEEFYLPFSISLAGNGQFHEALAAADSFLQIPTLNDRSRKAGNYRKKVYEFAIQQEKNLDSTYVFGLRNLGDSVNSKESEYYPSLPIDGSRLVFTRRVEDRDEDFFQCDRINDSTWTKAAPIKGLINTELNEGAQHLSQDGKWLLFTACNYPDGDGSCDIYISYMNKKGLWNEAKTIGHPVNSEFWESSPSLSPDKQDLYFASNRTGGYGGKDIYVSHRQADGSWSEPENLGPQINTVADEGCPFIHTDNHSLYFNSNGLMGYGAADLFVTRKQPDGSWGDPVNLGYPVNSIDEEGSMVVASDGVTAYYTSDRTDSKGKLDLYSFKLPRFVAADSTLWVKGKIYDKKTNAGLPSRAELTDIATGEKLYSLQTDEDGYYLVPLPLGKDYAFNVNRSGYLFYSENFSLSGVHPDSPRTIMIGLQPITSGAAVILKNIFFDINKFTLRAESGIELDIIYKLMKENPKLVIEIAGHTDNVGSEADNQRLSLNRSNEVVNYLIARGIDKSRIQAKGYGASNPIAPNNSPEGRALNRRTELRIISN